MSVICLSSDDEDDCIILDRDEEEELQQHKVFIVESGANDNVDREDQSEVSKKDNALQILATKLAEGLENYSSDITRLAKPKKKVKLRRVTGQFEEGKNRKSNSKSNSKMKPKQRSSSDCRPSRNKRLSTQLSHTGDDENPQSDQCDSGSRYRNKLKFTYDKKEATYSVSVVSPSKDNCTEYKPIKEAKHCKNPTHKKVLTINSDKFLKGISSKEPAIEEKRQVYSLPSKHNHAEYEPNKKESRLKKTTQKNNSSITSDKTPKGIPLEELNIEGKQCQGKLEAVQFFEMRTPYVNFKKHYSDVFSRNTDLLCIDMGQSLKKTINKTKQLQNLIQTAENNLTEGVNCEESCGYVSENTNLNHSIEVCKGTIDRLKIEFIENFSKIHSLINLNVIDTQLKIVLLTAWFVKMFLSITPSPQDLCVLIQEARAQTLHLLSEEIVRWPLVSKVFFKEETVFEIDCLLMLGFIKDFLEGETDQDTSIKETCEETNIENGTSGNNSKNQHPTLTSNDSKLNGNNEDVIKNPDGIKKLSKELQKLAEKNIDRPTYQTTTHSSMRKSEQAKIHQTKFSFSSRSSLSHSPSREPLQILPISGNPNNNSRRSSKMRRLSGAGIKSASKVSEKCLQRKIIESKVSHRLSDENDNSKRVANTGSKRKNREDKNHQSKHFKRSSLTENEKCTLSSKKSNIFSNTKREYLPNSVRTSMHSKNKAVAEELHNKQRAAITVRKETKSKNATEFPQPSINGEPLRIMCRLKIPDRALHFYKKRQLSKNDSFSNQDQTLSYNPDEPSSGQKLHSRPLKHLHYKSQFQFKNIGGIERSV